MFAPCFIQNKFTNLLKLYIILFPIKSIFKIIITKLLDNVHNNNINNNDNNNNFNENNNSKIDNHGMFSDNYDNSNDDDDDYNNDNDSYIHNVDNIHNNNCCPWK